MVVVLGLLFLDEAGFSGVAADHASTDLQTEGGEKGGHDFDDFRRPWRFHYSDTCQALF